MPQDTPTASPPARRDPIWEATQMDDEPVTMKPLLAIQHVLEVIRTLPEVGYELGLGTQSFSLLTEALASMQDYRVEAVRRRFAPLHAAPRGAADKQRLDWLQARILEMPPEYAAMLGLSGFRANLRDAIDRTMDKEKTHA